MNTSPLDLNLGIDFGTQFTKVCIRDTALERSWVVTFANTDNHINTTLLNDALLPTQVCIDSNGILSAGLTQSEWQQQTQDFSIIIDYIKMRLANLDLVEEGKVYPSNYLEQFHGNDLNSPENLENICAYYLSRVILKAKKWFCEHHADLVKNQNISWAVNIGVPVKYYDSPSLKRFEKVLYFAWLLSDSLPQSISLSFSQLQAKMQELRINIDDASKEIPCFAIPEIAAGVYSYTVSRQAVPGLYIFFDIGSGTIEGASFRFWREDEMPKIDFYIGEVEPLGVNALANSISNKATSLRLQVKEDIIHNSEKLLQDIQNLSEVLMGATKRGDFICNRFKVTDKIIEKNLLESITPQQEKLLHLILEQASIHKQVGKVIMKSKAKNKDNNLVIFLGGGGRESQYYSDTIKSTYFAFNHQYAGVPKYEVQELPFPKDDLDMNGIQHNRFHRFAVAYGLSIPEYQAPEVKLPSRFPYKPPKLLPSILTTPEIGRYPDDNSSM
jgi:molecular chaperone DnaK (HSP70)